MEQILTEQERKHLDQSVADVEKRTGAQIVLAVVKRSDAYAELPWMAFALGVAVGGMGTVFLDLLRPGWHSVISVLFAMVATLAAGAACALLCVAVPGVARFFLAAHRAEVEVRQYAQSLFLSREVFATRGRTGVLLLVSMFERQVVLLPDSGMAVLLGGEAMQNIVGSMAKALADGRVSVALEKGLQGLEENLPEAGAPLNNELPDTIVEEKGI